jgi:aminoglycoside phosphotransferase (APT) family kinase protein
VPAPAILAVETDTSYLGAPFLVMELVEGRPAGEVPGLDAWIVGAPLDRQRRVQDAFVDLLAQLHRTESSGEVTARLRHGIPAEIEYWASYIDWSSDGAPPHTLRDAIIWCRGTAPDAPSTSLLWGDARLGNVMYDDTPAVVAALDWELATIGPPEMDLGWYLALDALTAKATGTAVPGFRPRPDVIARYERGLGRTVQHLEWHEVFALIRSAAVTDRLARLAARTGVPSPGAYGDDNPLLGYVARRIDRYGAAASS